MDIIELTTREAIIYVALINAAVGFFLGLIPLCFGVIRGKTKLGVLGILSATIGGAILGVFLSVPAMAIFTWLIIRRPKVASTDEAPFETDSDDRSE